MVEHFPKPFASKEKATTADISHRRDGSHMGLPEHEEPFCAELNHCNDRLGVPSKMLMPRGAIVMSCIRPH